ncbi:putative dolichyl-diphosphooligosaccharide--protein glycosyltransferase subunit 3 [Curcuma longa]|uniref:putative dolichyl-diphosphooligosaccharide--protein glycosyltransferase subunit 3 n=1 Tax=Curcuma longa TaxID=136217 RepID=UPI003D9F99BF
MESQRRRGADKMAILFQIAAVLLLLLMTGGAAGRSADDLVAELKSLRSQSPSGVIHLDDRLVSRFLTSVGTPRPYSLLIFFDANQLRSKAELRLPHLHSEFSLLSASFSAHHEDDALSSRIFFCDVEFGQSQKSFDLFGVSSVPHVRLVPASTVSLRDSIPMDQSEFSRGADSMAEFLESKAKISLGGAILRPPPISPLQVLFLLAAILISAPFLVRRILDGDTLIHDQRLWMSLALFVYFFGVSGTMHNIIRNMPMVLPDRNNPDRLIFFYQGSGMQLGAEGFAIGFLYMVVGLVLAFVTHLLVRFRSISAQRGFMLVGMLLAYWAVSKVIYLDNWKTGYSIHSFRPKSWW